MATIDEEIRSQIEAFTGDLTALIKQAALEAVRSALGAGKATVAVAKPAAKPMAPAKAAAPAKPAAMAKKPAPSAPAPKAKAAPPAKKPPVKAAPAPKAPALKKPVAKLGAKRPPAELARLVERLGEYIKANPGLGMEAIGKAMGTPTSELTLPIKKLLASKTIRFEGWKRGTKYYPA